MKLATLNDGSRDGRLVVVSRDLTRCMPATGVAGTLQAALDNWAECEPPLAEIAERLDIAVGTSRSQLHHARHAVRRHLQKGMESDDARRA